MNKQKAIVPKDGPHNAINRAGEKELIRSLDVAVVSGKHAGTNPITVRWYMSRSRQASIVYCSLWVSTGTHFGSGSGRAAGYGFCKKSASFSEAVKSAGIRFSVPVAGVGSGAVYRACEAIARGAGIRGRLMFVSN